MRKNTDKTKKGLHRVIKTALPADLPPVLTDEQIGKLKTACGIALSVLGTGTMLLSVVAPNIFEIFERHFSNRKLTSKKREEKLIQTFYYLKHHGLIVMKPTIEDFKIFLTKLGKKKLQKLHLETLSVSRPKKWNGKWWQVAADIPTEDYKWAADMFREKLKEMKFYSLQRTLWFYPFDPRQELEFLLKYFKIGQFVTVMEVSRLDLDDETTLRNFFRKEKIL